MFVLGIDRGLDIVSDFIQGQDLLGLSGGLTFGQLEISQNNNNVLIKSKANGVAIATFRGVNISQIGASDFIFQCLLPIFLVLNLLLS
jgi:hypothetical protein